MGTVEICGKQTATFLLKYCLIVNCNNRDPKTKLLKFGNLDHM